jgi:hypothetical protein
MTPPYRGQPRRNFFLRSIFFIGPLTSQSTWQKKKKKKKKEKKNATQENSKRGFRCFFHVVSSRHHSLFVLAFQQFLACSSRSPLQTALVPHLHRQPFEERAARSRILQLAASKIDCLFWKKRRLVPSSRSFGAAGS